MMDVLKYVKYSNIMLVCYITIIMVHHYVTIIIRYHYNYKKYIKY